MNEQATEWIRVPYPHPPISEESLAEARAMLAADPEVRRRRELSALKETRSLTPEEQAEYDEILRPAREMAARRELD